MPFKSFTATLSRGAHLVNFHDGSDDGSYSRLPSINCDNPRNDQNTLDSLIHETLHQSLPKLSEREVVRVADDIACVLWHSGARFPRRKTRRRAQRSGMTIPRLAMDEFFRVRSEARAELQRRASPHLELSHAAVCFGTLAPPLEPVASAILRAHGMHPGLDAGDTGVTAHGCN